MKIICTKENLHKGLFVASKSVDQKGSLPILSTVLLEAKNGLVKLSSTNLETGIVCFFGGIIKEEGRFAVPAKIFSDYIANLPTEKVEILGKNDLLTISSGSFKAEIKTLPPDEFPLMPKVKSEAIFSLSGAVFKKVLAKIIFAATPDDSRPEISGICLDVKGDEIKGVATDGYRLAEGVLETTQKANTEGIFIVPLRAAQEIFRIISGDEEEVKVFISEGQIKLAFKDPTILSSEIEIVSKLVDGNYPAYQEIIPKNFKARAFLDKKELINVIKAVSLFSKKETSEINVLVGAKKGELVFLSESSLVGKNTSSVKCKIEGESLEISFNYHYLLEGLGALEGDGVELAFSGKGGPLIIKEEGDGSYLYIAMPLESGA